MDDEDYAYAYVRQSTVESAPGRSSMLLATSGGHAWQRASAHPYFFDGFVEHADIVAAALLVVARVARTRFYTPPGMLAAILRSADPVGAYFHRELPYRPTALQAQHPRLHDARTLVNEGRVSLRPGEALVQSGTATYVVRSTPDGERCTCAWFGAHGCERGPCKHTLAARIARRAVCPPPDPQ